MTFSAEDVVLTVARVFDFVREVPRNSNWGQAVERFLLTVGWKKPAPWCAAYVAFVGVGVFGKRWPLPTTASCYQLGESARKQKILKTTPARGDVFLLYFPKLGRFAHTGFIEEVLADGSCRTIEGNTNGGGSRDGWGVFKRTRTFGPMDRFIRWSEALPA